MVVATGSCYLIHSPAVPPPVSPTVTIELIAMSPQSIMITWTPQPMGHNANTYEILFERAVGDEQMGICKSETHRGSIRAQDGTLTEYLLTGLQEYSTYTVTITASNEFGSIDSNVAEVTTLHAGMFQTHFDVALTRTLITFLLFL